MHVGCDLRTSAEALLLDLEGVHFAVTSITGIQTNARAKGTQDEPESPPRQPRPGLAFIVCYTPSAQCESIDNLFTKMELGTETTKPEMKEIQSKANEATSRSNLVLSQSCTAL